MIIQNRIPMVIDDLSVHPEFKLNGTSYTRPELKELCSDLIKKRCPFENKIGFFISDWLDEKSSIKVKTSGSTGAPKDILLQKIQMVNSALATAEYFALKPGDTALLCLSADYIAGKMMLVRAMVLGLELDYVEPTSIPLRKITKNYDFGAMVPLQLKNSLDDIEKIKTLIVGGSSLSISIRNQIDEKSTAIYETYGMTETITHIAVKKVNHNLLEIENIFKGLPNIVFSTDDRECLTIFAPKISDHPVVTNDIVNLISKTEFEWLGRYDNVVNSGGIKLFPEHIEAKLSRYISNRFFVVGIPDEELGEKLVLIVEGEIDSDELIQTLREESRFEWFEIPKKVYKLLKFTETETGKIKRNENLQLINK